MLTTKQIRALDPRCKPYKLQLTPAEVAALDFLNGRYSWVTLLRENIDDDGLVALTEVEAWDWVQCALDDDTLFPGAGGDFCLKLVELYQNII